MKLKLKCLTIAAAIACLAAPTVQVATATSRPAVRSVTVQHVEPSQAQPNVSGTSYLWSYIAVTAAALAGILVLGLWGDVAVGGAIVGIQLLWAGVAAAGRRLGAHAREAPRWERVPESSAATSPR